MRKISFSVTPNGSIEPSLLEIGHEGEHNATTLIATLPKELLLEATYYRLAIGSYQTDKLYAENNTLSYTVPQCVLICGTQFLQLEGYKNSAEGEMLLVFKSDIAMVNVLPSIDPYNQVTDEVKCEVDSALGKLHYYVTQSDELASELKSTTDECASILEEAKQTVYGKADKADTLSGYGITDAYTKEETDNKFANAILDYITYEIAGNEVTITGCDTSISGAHIIPDIIEGYPVTKIADSAFRSCKNITSITIPNSVSSIGNSAFWSCSGITSIVLPTKIDSLCDYAFGYCTKLAFVVIPSEINSIAGAAFGGCPSLEHVYYGGTPESWENLMTGLHLHLDDSTIHFANMYETYSKSETDALLKYKADKSTTLEGYGITDSYTKEECDFRYTSREYVDSGFEEVDFKLKNKADKNKILDYITYQIVNGSVTITDCDTSISGTHIIPEIIEGYPVTVIGNSAFSKCSGLVSITIPNSVIDIGDSAFNGCTALESLVIPDGITIIKADSIPGKYLKKLYLPDSILTIEEGIFPDVGEEHSIEVYYNGTRDQWLKVQMTGFANEGYGSYVTLHCKYDDVPFKPKRLSFADGDTITLANNTTYYANSEISSLTVIYPKTNFICSLEFTLATEGDVTITLPQSRYIGGAPTFANGEAWELNIKNGVVVGGLVE